MMGPRCFILGVTGIHAHMYQIVYMNICDVIICHRKEIKKIEKKVNQTIDVHLGSHQSYPHKEKHLKKLKTNNFSWLHLKFLGNPLPAESETGKHRELYDEVQKPRSRNHCWSQLVKYNQQIARGQIHASLRVKNLKSVCSSLRRLLTSSLL